MSRRPASADSPVKVGTASPSRPAKASPVKAGPVKAGAAQANGHGIPDATVARLPVYLRALNALAEQDVPTVSSEELAAATGVNSAKLRKDLSHLGSYGTRGVGYDVEYLVYQVSRELGLTQDWPVLIVGAGNLGRALANYGGFASRGFRIAALLDRDPRVVGTVIAHHKVRSDAEIEQVIDRFQVSIGVIATPAAAAQGVCDRLVAAGVTSILNFAPVVLTVPSGVDVRKVDLSIELQILAFHAQRRAIAPGARDQDAITAGVRRGAAASRELGLAAAADGMPPGGLPRDSMPRDSLPRDGLPPAGVGARPDGQERNAAEVNYRTGAQAVGT
jgi:redox-sensing transcriptional repressor